MLLKVPEMRQVKFRIEKEIKMEEAIFVRLEESSQKTILALD